MNFLDLDCIFTLGELLENKTISRGDCIRLPSTFRSYTIFHQNSGCKNDQNFALLPHTPVIACFTGVVEHGYCKFISNISFNVKLEGTRSFLQKKNILDELCKEMVGFPLYNIFAFSITNDEFESFNDLIMMQVKGKPKSIYLEREITLSGNYGFHVATISHSVIKRDFAIMFNEGLNETNEQTYSVCPILRVPASLYFKNIDSKIQLLSDNPNII